MTTSTGQMFNIMKTLEKSDAEKNSEATPNTFTQPPSIPTPRKDKDFGVVLAECLNLSNKPGNTPR
jgi:hypothetical protein